MQIELEGLEEEDSARKIVEKAIELSKGKTKVLVASTKQRIYEGAKGNNDLIASKEARDNIGFRYFESIESLRQFLLCPFSSSSKQITSFTILLIDIQGIVDESSTLKMVSSSVAALKEYSTQPNCPIERVVFILPNDISEVVQDWVSIFLL